MLRARERLQEEEEDVALSPNSILPLSEPLSSNEAQPKSCDRNGRRLAAAPQSVATYICCPFFFKGISGLNAGRRILNGLSVRLLFQPAL